MRHKKDFFFPQTVHLLPAVLITGANLIGLKMGLYKFAEDSGDQVAANTDCCLVCYQTLSPEQH